MTERPILFNSEMVRAILDGRKTQTRRVVKNPEYFGCLTGDCSHSRQDSCDYSLKLNCPFGKVGDVLWVRETWGVGERLHPIKGSISGIEFRADIALLEGSDDLPLYHIENDSLLSLLLEKDIVGWKPSIHMPRWASRISLEITDIKVERLNEITLHDAIKEGCTTSYPLESFCNLWQSVYGQESWNSNPWVWAISFKRIK